MNLLHSIPVNTPDYILLRKHPVHGASPKGECEVRCHKRVSVKIDINIR